MPRKFNCPCAYCPEVFDNARRRRVHMDNQHTAEITAERDARLEEYRQVRADRGPSRLKRDTDVWPARP
jgi:hypothetical protein